MKEKSKISTKIGRRLPQSDVGDISKFILEKAADLSFSNLSNYLR